MLGACSLCSWHTSSVPWLMADVTDFCCCCLSRDIFTAWVAARGGGSTYPVKWNQPPGGASSLACPPVPSLTALQCSHSATQHGLRIHAYMYIHLCHSTWLGSLLLSHWQAASVTLLLAWGMTNIPDPQSMPWLGSYSSFWSEKLLKSKSVNRTRVCWLWQFLIGDTVAGPGL